MDKLQNFKLSWMTNTYRNNVILVCLCKCTTPEILSYERQKLQTVQFDGLDKAGLVHGVVQPSKDVERSIILV